MNATVKEDGRITHAPSYYCRKITAESDLDDLPSGLYINLQFAINRPANGMLH